MNIPTGYTPLRLNTMVGSTTAHLICRRPDGGVSDLRKVLKTPTLSGICPACGRDMKSAGTGRFTCANGHLLIKMTNSEATARHFAPTHKPVRRITERKAPVTFPALRTTVREPTTDEDIAAVVEQAMKEAMI